MTPGFSTIEDALRYATARLTDAGLASPRQEARQLVAAALGIDSLALYSASDRAYDPALQARLIRFIDKRTAGEPVSRIRGEREFWSLPIGLSDDVLDPRPETELLVEAALAHLGRKQANGRPIHILDIGTGSGCLLLALLSELPNAVGTGIDRSPGALRTAAANAQVLGLANRALWLCGSWVSPVSWQFDLVVSNPPYIASGAIATLDRGVRAYDPALALDGGPDGLAAYRAIIPALRPVMQPTGAAFLEIGCTQAAEVTGIARRSGFHAQTAMDLAGMPRCVALMPEI